MNDDRYERFETYLKRALGHDLSDAEVAILWGVRMTDPTLGARKTKDRIRRAIGKFRDGKPLDEVLLWVARQAPQRETSDLPDWRAAQEWLDQGAARN